jgi:hypothetical protein
MSDEEYLEHGGRGHRISRQEIIESEAEIARTGGYGFRFAGKSRRPTCADSRLLPR